VAPIAADSTLRDGQYLFRDGDREQATARNIADLHFHIGARVRVRAGNIEGDHFGHFPRLLFRHKAFAGEIVMDVSMEAEIEKIALHRGTVLVAV
jgi:hypothetical protein